MLLLVTASRTWPDRELMRAKLTKFYRKFGYFTLLCGNAYGGDEMAQLIAGRDLACDLELHPANWKRYGHAAGMIRNAKMVARKPDWCLAFIHNGSPGSTGCLNLVVKAGIKRRVYRINDSDR